MAKDLVLEIRAQNQELKQKLAESKRELNEFKRAVKEANAAGESRGFNNFSNILETIGLKGKNASGVMGFLTGSLGKVAGALGIAMTAAEGFNKMMESSNALGDEVERIQTQAGMAVNYFASSLANVDFSNFWQGLQNAIDGGGEFADVLDRINTSLQQLGVKTSKIDVEIAKKELQIAALPRGSKERLKLEKEHLQLVRKKGQAQKPINADQIKASKELMKATLGYDDAMMKKMNPAIEAYLDGGNKGYEYLGNAWKRLQKNKGGTGFAPGTTNIGGKSSKEDAAQQKKDLALINAYAKKAGISFKQAMTHAREFYRINDVGDNGPDSTGFKARQLYTQGNQGEVESLKAEAAVVSRITMEKQRASKQALKAQKEQETLAKKTYTANAQTIFEMKANVAYLEEKKEKTLPSSEEFTKITNEIKLWQKKIEEIEFDDSTIAGLNAQLKSVNDELDRTKKGTETFYALKRVAQGLRDEIQDLSLDEYVLNPKTTREIENNIERLKKRMADLEPNTDQWKFYKAEIEELQEMLQEKPAKGSLLDLESQIAKINETLSKAPLSLSARVKLLDQKEDLQKKLDEKASGITLSAPTYKRSAEGNSKAANYESAVSAANAIQQDYVIGLVGYEDVKAKMQEINNFIKSLGMEPLDIKISSKGTKKAEKAVNGVAEALGATSDAFAALGQIAEDPALDIAGIIAGAIANVMFGYAQATVAATSMGPWAWIAFAIAGLATAMATVASIKSATDGYAGGGIIGGNSYSGDNLYARVNSGEMILNGHQQRNLFKAIDEGRLGGGNGIGNVEFVLRGSDLYGTLKNYAHMKSNAGRNINIF